MDIRIIIFTNGNLDSNWLHQIADDDLVIGVDRAAYFLIKHHVIPDLAVGDFDSTSENEMASIKHFCKKIVSFSADKDYTDTELAVNEALKFNPREIIINGAIGTRMDHTLANISLLEKLVSLGIPCSIRDNHNEIQLIKDKLVVEKNKIFKYFSVIPVTDSIILSLDGFLYNLNRKTITRGQTLGISNEISGKSAIITVYRGLALVIRSCD
jgi:thiamine pyrophosphokinase